MKVLKPFRDKYNPEVIYKPGDKFVSDDPARIDELVERGLIEGVCTPSYAQLTKKELQQTLTKKGIKFDAKANKTDLIALLGGE